MQDKILDEQIGVRIDRETKDALTRKAKSEGRKTSEVVLRLIQKYLNEESNSSRIEEVNIAVKQLQEKVKHLETALLGKSPA